MRIVAYAYTAAIHCPDCAAKCFHDLDINEFLVDSEGNGVKPLLRIELEGNDEYCDTCNEQI